MLSDVICFYILPDVRLDNRLHLPDVLFQVSDLSAQKPTAVPLARRACMCPLLLSHLRSHTQNVFLLDHIYHIYYIYIYFLIYHM